MILDLPLNVTVDIGIVMLSVLFYAGGLVTVMAIRKFRSLEKRDSYSADDAVVEAVVLEYTRRLREYDRVIAELRTRLDIVEVRTQVLSGQQVASTSHQGPHARPVSEPVTLTQHPPTITQEVAGGTVVDSTSFFTSSSTTTSQPPPAAARTAVTSTEVEGQNGTVDYILKLLAERPRTSREVQHAIGRSREHTSRLMKKLNESGLVNRDVNSKPFRYNITEAGRTRLVVGDKTSVAQAPEIRQQKIV
jgi:DNA-binding transcriptional ArsR family regulator